MKVMEIRDMARNLGVKKYSRFSKPDLIRAVQVAEGNSPCYQQIFDCRVYDCLWREECQAEPL